MIKEVAKHDDGEFKFFTNTSKDKLKKDNIIKLNINTSHHIDPINNDFLKNGMNIIYTTYESC